MNLKPSLILILLAATFTAKSQEYLNNDSTQIKKKVLAYGGIFRGTIMQDSFEAPGNYYEMEFVFPGPTYEKDGIVEMNFYVSLKNYCFQYDVSYYGNVYKRKLKETFNNPSSGLKQKDSLNWENRKEKYQLEIMRNFPVNGKMEPFYTLEIRKMEKDSVGH